MLTIGGVYIIIGPPYIRLYTSIPLKLLPFAPSFTMLTIGKVHIIVGPLLYKAAGLDFLDLFSSPTRTTSSALFSGIFQRVLQVYIKSYFLLPRVSLCLP